MLIDVLKDVRSRQPSTADVEIVERWISRVAGVHENLDAITKLTVYVTSFDWFEELAAIRGELFPVGPPASSLIQVAGLVLAEFLIEVDAVAAI